MRPATFVAYLVALIVWWQTCGFLFGGGSDAAHDAGPRTQLPARFAAASTQPTPQPAADAAVPGKNAASIAATQPAATQTHAAAAAASTPAPAAAASARAVSSAAVPGWAVGLHKEIALDNPACPSTRRPFHTLLTGQGSTYNGWQSRIMYYHWRKQRAADGACTEMTGFTRLCASEDGKPDPAAPYIPSVFVPALTSEHLAKYGHFGVLNRPHSVVEFFKRPEMVALIVEKYILLAETDHVFMQPMPNLVQDDPPRAAAHTFGYMHASPRHDSVVKYCWPEGDHTSLQPVGPSPLLIEKNLLQLVAVPWLNCSYILRGRPEPAQAIQDWVLEMWGYTIAAASLGIAHKVRIYIYIDR